MGDGSHFLPLPALVEDELDGDGLVEGVGVDGSLSVPCSGLTLSAGEPELASGLAVEGWGSPATYQRSPASFIGTL